jgi:SpoU rRNA methylase family enzyme
VGDESAAATQQIANTTQAIAAINTKIAATQALTPATPEGVTQKNLLLAELGQQVQVMNNLKNIAQANLTRLDGEIASLKQDLTSSTTEYNSLLPTPA